MSLISSSITVLTCTLSLALIGCAPTSTDVTTQRLENEKLKDQLKENAAAMQSLSEAIAQRDASTRANPLVSAADADQQQITANHGSGPITDAATALSSLLSPLAKDVNDGTKALNEGVLTPLEEARATIEEAKRHLKHKK